MTTKTDIKVSSDNRAVDRRREVNFPVDRGLLAAETGGSADDGYKAALGHEKHLLNVLEGTLGKLILRTQNPKPGIADVVKFGGDDLADAVLTLHKDLFRSKGGTAVDLPIATEVKAAMWPYLEALLMKSPECFTDPERYAKHLAWWKKNGIPLKKVMPIGGSLSLEPAARS